jgi:hypothetical protein
VDSRVRTFFISHLNAAPTPLHAASFSGYLPASRIFLVQNPAYSLGDACTTGDVAEQPWCVLLSRTQTAALMIIPRFTRIPPLTSHSIIFLLSCACAPHCAYDCYIQILRTGSTFPMRPMIARHDHSTPFGVSDSLLALRGAWTRRSPPRFASTYAMPVQYTSCMCSVATRCVYP